MRKFIAFSVMALGFNPTVLKAFKDQARCELGCIHHQPNSYDGGVWDPQTQICYCQDNYNLDDLYLREFRLRYAPSNRPGAPPSVDQNWL